MVSKATITSDFMCELHCENIPSRLQTAAATQWESLARHFCQNHAISYTTLRAHSTPRRMVLILEGIPVIRAATTTYVKGPRQGVDESILVGFCTRTGQQRENLILEKKSQGTFWMAPLQHPQQDQGELLKKLILQSLDQFHWPKTMRWGHSHITWIRPLRGLMTLWCGSLLPLTVDPEGEPIASQTSTAWGPISLHPETAPHITTLKDYEQNLKERSIILQADERRHHIITLLHTCCPPHTTLFDEDFDVGQLLDNVSGLSEWPYVGLGTFDERFLKLPAAVLKTVMRFHQRAFPVKNIDGSLAPFFLFVSTQRVSAAILRGHESVMRGRLNDAQFFWQKDLALPLAHHGDKLTKRQFFHNLGTLADKQNRLVALTRQALPEKKDLHQAASLAKADLATDMVEEFPELAGVMGAAYGEAQGLNSAVTTAIFQHVAPLGIPLSFEGKVLGIVDAVDTLTGFFAQDKVPTGSKDPLGLRRTALTLLQRSAQNPVTSLNLNDLLTHSYHLYGFTKAPLNLESTRQAFWTFMRERWIFWFNETFSMDGKHAEALWHSGFFQKTWDLEALLRQAPLWKNFWNAHASEALKQSWRRVYAYVTKVAKDVQAHPLDPTRLTTPAEQQLYAAIPLKPLPDFNFLATAAPLIDTFFDTVRLDDPAEGPHRFSLLYKVYTTCHHTLDLTPLLF